MNIPDFNFKVELNYAIGIFGIEERKTHIPTDYELSTITRFENYSIEGAITDITGAEYLVNCTDFSIHSYGNENSKVSNLSILGELTKLVSLQLSNQGCDDVSFLSNFKSK